MTVAVQEGASFAASLEGKVAIITGASGGVGLSCARRFVASGSKVVAVGRNLKNLEKVREELGPGNVEVLSHDVSNDSAPAAIVGAAARRWGRLDFLINNAGLGKPKPLHETSDLELDDFLDVMLRAPFRISREAVQHMPKGGAIINISSTFAIAGGLRGGAYSAAKAGLDGLTRHIACQYGAQGIRSNSVAPGLIQTDMTQSRMTDEGFRRMHVELTPHRRLATVADVSSMVVFLCSEHGEFINGETIVIDGGWSTTRYLSDRARLSRWSDG